MNAFIKNHLYPILGGLLAVVLQAVYAAMNTGELQANPKQFLWSLAFAVLGYLLTITQRYAGKQEPWTQEPKAPDSPPST